MKSSIKMQVLFNHVVIVVPVFYASHSMYFGLFQTSTESVFISYSLHMDFLHITVLTDKI